MAVSLGATILSPNRLHPAPEGTDKGRPAEVTGPSSLSLLADPQPLIQTESSATISVVIPAKNEARNLAWVLRRIPSFVDEVILVDGHSTDDTIAVARAIRPDVVVLAEERPGKGAALRQGFAAATGDFVIMLDADCSMEPAEIERMVAVLAEGCDMVKGSRFMVGGGTEDISPIRDLGNAALVRMTNILFRTKHTDLCYGYMGFRRGQLLSLLLEADGFEIETEIVLRAIKAGLTIAEIPSFEAARRFGSSNLHAFRDGTRVLRTIVRERLGRRGNGLQWSFPAPSLLEWLGMARPVHAAHAATSETLVSSDDGLAPLHSDRLAGARSGSPDRPFAAASLVPREMVPGLPDPWPDADA